MTELLGKETKTNSRKKSDVQCDHCGEDCDISIFSDQKYFCCLKINMMRKNPRVCFQVDNMVNMANWQSVISWGEYEELKEQEERNHALQLLNDPTLPVITSKTVQLSPQWPFPLKDLESIRGIVYRIHLREKTGRFESNTESFGIA